MVDLHLSWRELAAGFGFVEGPVVMGDRLAFTSINRGKVYRLPIAGGSVEMLAETGGGPNGTTLGADGELWVAQNGGHVVPTKSAIACAPSIQRISADGKVSTVSASGFSAPNDCAFGPDGRLWFTDPAGSTEDTRPRPGKLWAMEVGSGKCEMILDGLAHPNGLAFGPDSDLLYIGETRRRRIIRLQRSTRGWREAGVFAEMPVGEPDGMAFDTQGRLWVAATKADAVIMFSPDGKEFMRAPIGSPSFPTNLCFGGPGHRTLLVTAPKGGRVLAAEIDVPGLPLL